MAFLNSDNDIADNIFSVSEITRHIRKVKKKNIPPLFIEGEIANFVNHSSGHLYFSLKDEKSTIKCTFFRNSNFNLNFMPSNGAKVICAGKITVYEKSGNYQFNISRMYPAGIGLLQLRFEELKRKLAEEGLFDEIYKKPLPAYPDRIGIITSVTGAAFQDIKNVLSRRFPVDVILYPAAVQGDSAPEELIAGLEYFNKLNDLDLIIIGRGGGSQEDLFCFNDEELARAVFASKIPVISAVGHEIDFTIIDFVADLRAPTPSAAAELAVPAINEVIRIVDHLTDRLRGKVERYVSQFHNTLLIQEKKLTNYHPLKILRNYKQRINEAEFFLQATTRKIVDLRNKVELLCLGLGNSTRNAGIRLSRQKEEQLVQLRTRLQELVLFRYNNLRADFQIKQEKFHELSPYEALKRGYAILRHEKKIINSVKSLKPDQHLEALLSDGKCLLKVERIDK